MIPSANKYLQSLEDEERNEYLSSNTWITWNGRSATFTFADYVAHVGRMKGLPAFDDFEMKKPEPSLFGDQAAEARHYTEFSLQQTSGDKSAELDGDLRTVVNLMNPMFFIGQDSPGCASYWWLRNGTRDAHTSQTIIANLAAGLKNRYKDVSAWLYWDAGHCEDDDPEGLIDWIGNITGRSKHV